MNPAEINIRRHELQSEFFQLIIFFYWFFLLGARTLLIFNLLKESCFDLGKEIRTNESLSFFMSSYGFFVLNIVIFEGKSL